MPARIVYRGSSGNAAGVITLPVARQHVGRDSNQTHQVTLGGKRVEIRGPRSLRTWSLDLGLIPEATSNPLVQFLDGLIGDRRQPVAFYPADSTLPASTNFLALPSDGRGAPRCWLVAGDDELVSTKLGLWRRSLTVLEA